MRPREVIDLGPPDFGDATACLGRQLVELLCAIDAVSPGLRWYGADVETIGPFPIPQREPVPSLVGDTPTLVRAARFVEQFKSGVFVGVPDLAGAPTFRNGGLWTEDEADADLGDATFEVRAFDTSYWSVGTADAGLAARIRERFRAGRERTE